jgi:hypothetical protein
LTDGTGFPAPVVARPLRRHCVHLRGAHTRPTLMTTTTTMTARRAPPRGSLLSAGCEGHPRRLECQGGGESRREVVRRRGGRCGGVSAEVWGGGTTSAEVCGGWRGQRRARLIPMVGGGLIDKSTRGGGGERLMDASPQNGAVRVQDCSAVDQRSLAVSYATLMALPQGLLLPDAGRFHGKERGGERQLVGGNDSAAAAGGGCRRQQVWPQVGPRRRHG